ncbi:MAG: CRISPR system precrRNA processing endoribonuclease RAMP protein Cas6, partial [Actinobacteria bacterium]|nr:CRISPR system precrRNA processing endoribonuclease RAMP protein Cas6 [Actinomycetota bacterium]
MASFVKHESVITEKKYFFEEIFIQNFYVRLRFKRDIKFLFYHGSKIYGLIAKILDLHPTEKEQRNINDIVINPCEYGRIYYNAGDQYCFGVTFLKDGYDFENKIKSYFSSTSDSGFSNDLTNSSVELADVNELSNQIEYQTNYSSNIHTINFVTPLRIERKKEEKVKGGTLFDISHFNFQRFLYILYKRAKNLYKLNFESEPSFEIPSIPSAEIIEKSFIWIEMPKKEQKRNTGGIVGNIKLKCELDEFWLKLIQLGQFFHAGKSTSAGFGKYIFNNCNLSSLSIKPAKSYLDLILEKENLVSAFKHIKENSNFAGVDNVNPDFYEDNLNKNLEHLTESVINGSYKSAVLKGIIIPKSENKIRALAIPTVEDRTFQRAVSQILSPSIDEML